ncbi:MAG TPA: hypothetical protein V6D25_11100 [Leptolyngbyaceae cyanobacterium]
MNVFFWRSIRPALGDRQQKTFTPPDYSLNCQLIMHLIILLST